MICDVTVFKNIIYKSVITQLKGTGKSNKKTSESINQSIDLQTICWHKTKRAKENK